MTISEIFKDLKYRALWNCLLSLILYYFIMGMIFKILIGINSTMAGLPRRQNNAEDIRSAGKLPRLV